jgi:hypothetical protein
MKPRDRTDPAQEFRRVELVLRGQTVSEDVPALAKMLKIILSPPDGVDVEISPSGFRVRYPHHRKAFSYFADLAPATVQALLRFGGVTTFSRTAAFRIDPDRSHAPPILDSYLPRWSWVRVDDDAIRIAVRPAIAAGPPPEVPDDLPPPLPLPVKRYATFPEPLTCSRCDTRASTFRRVEDALVCGACGCSFRPRPAVLLRGVIRAEAGLQGEAADTSSGPKRA